MSKLPAVGALSLGCIFASTSAHGSPMHLWSRHFGNYSIDIANDVAAHPASGFVITGEVATLVDLGGGYLIPVQGASSFFAKYDHDCNHQWSKLFDEAWSAQVALDYQGNTHAVGVCGGD